MNEKTKYLSYPFLCRLCSAFWHLDRHQNADDFLLCYLDRHPSPDDSSLWPRRKNNCRGEWTICCCCCWVIKLCLTLWALKMISGWNWQLKGRPNRHPDEGTAAAVHVGTCGNQLGKLWPQRDGWYLLEPAGLGCPQRMGPLFSGTISRGQSALSALGGTIFSSTPPLYVCLWNREQYSGPVSWNAGFSPLPWDTACLGNSCCLPETEDSRILLQMHFASWAKALSFTQWETYYLICQR